MPYTSDTPHYENRQVGKANVPFEIPSSWEWTEVGNIGEIVTGSTPSKDIPEYYGGDIPFYKPTDLEQGKCVKRASDHLSLLGFEQARKLPVKSVLITCIGATIGKTGLITIEGSCNQQINAIIPHDFILAEFIYDVCTSDYFQDEIKFNASATTLPILNKGNFAKLLFPLPPLAEQIRIVAEIEKWFALIEQIEQEKTDLLTAIKQTKSKILDLAIQGKLVVQDPSDEPASELLKRINPNAEITCDNGHYGKIPFEQPSSWVWCRLGDVVSIKSGDSISVRNNQDGKYPIYGGNGINGYYCDNNVETGTIIIGRVGFYCGSVHITESKAWVTDNAFIVCYKNVFNPIYLSYLLRWLQLNKTSNSTAQPVISGKGIYPLLIPIPPITEQQRIVDAIDNINSRLDAIMESL